MDISVIVRIYLCVSHSLKAFGTCKRLPVAVHFFWPRLKRIHACLFACQRHTEILMHTIHTTSIVDELWPKTCHVLTLNMRNCVNSIEFKCEITCVVQFACNPKRSYNLLFILLRSIVFVVSDSMLMQLEL